MEGKIELTDNMRKEIEKAVKQEGSYRALSRSLGYTPQKGAIDYLLTNAKTIHVWRWEKIKIIVNGVE